MTKASIYSGLTVLALCLAGCGSKDSTADAAASESTMADTGMASEGADGAMMADPASPMATDAAGMETGSNAMGGPDAMGSGGAMKGAAPMSSSSPEARKAAGQPGQ